MHPNDLTLNDYADDVLGAADRADVDRHLASCAACRALVDDLRAVANAAAALAPVEPPAGVWPRLADAIRRESGVPLRAPGAGRSLRTIGWLAAAALLAVATLVALRLGPLAPRRQVPITAVGRAPSAADSGADQTQSVEAELREAEAHYDKAIKGLEQIANAGAGSLDPKTAATLQKNLSVIDQALSESRAAVRAQPNSEPAQASLFDNFKAKVGLLQDTVALINEMRKGNDAGAARIVSGLKGRSE